MEEASSQNSVRSNVHEVKQPLLLSSRAFVAGSLVLAVVLGLLGVWLYKPSPAHAELNKKLADLALDGAFGCLLVLAVKELLARRDEGRARNSRRLEVQTEFFRRTRDAYSRVIWAKDMLEAHKSAKTWSEQSRELIRLREEFNQLAEDMGNLPNLFESQDKIGNDLRDIVHYLDGCRREYIRCHDAVDADWKTKKTLEATFHDQKMTWIVDFIESKDGFKDGVQRAAVASKAKMAADIYCSTNV